MIEQLRQDLAAAPRAFSLVGPGDRAAIDEAVSQLGHPASEPVRQFWAAVGGGSMFETEDILGPTARELYDLATRNAELWSEGLRRDLLAFHSGLYLTVVDRSGSILRLDSSTLTPVGRFDSLEDWYSDLRKEYGAIYGLPGAAELDN